MTKRLFGFVLMPFRDEFRERYELGIKGAIQDAGMHCERVDEQIFHRERILERIYAQIDASDFVIADLTGQNLTYSTRSATRTPSRSCVSCYRQRPAIYHSI